MTGVILVSAALAAGAVVLVLPRPDLGRVASTGRAPGSGPARDAHGEGSVDAPAGGGWTPRRVRGVGMLAGLALWLLVGGALGAVAGVGVALGFPPAVARLEPARVRRERRDLVRAAPLVADLLGASLQAGVPLERAVPVVARSVGGPSARALLSVHRATQLGEPTSTAWAALAQSPGLGGIARAIARSTRTGAPMAGILAQAATDLRAEAAAAALEQVRSTAVRAVLPLGLCLLPAFALLGIAPIVGGLLPSL